MIPGVVFQKVVKTNTIIQNVFTSVQASHSDIQVTDVKEIDVVTVGGTIVYEIATEEQAITVAVEEETGEIHEIAVDPVPEEIVPIFVETTTNEQGNQIIYASGSSVSVIVSQQ